MNCDTHKYIYIIFIYICIYIYIYTCICICMYIYIHIYIHEFTNSLHITTYLPLWPSARICDSKWATHPHTLRWTCYTHPPTNSLNLLHTLTHELTLHQVSCKPGVIQTEPLVNILYVESNSRTHFTNSLHISTYLPDKSDWRNSKRASSLHTLRELGSNSYQEKARSGRHLLKTTEKKHLPRLRLILKGAESRLVYTLYDETNLRTHSWTHSIPQTEKIGLRIITTAKFPSNFHGSPRTFQTNFHGNPKNYQQVSTGVKRSPLIVRENCIIWRSKHLKPDLLAPPSVCFYCTSICMRFGCTRRASCVDSKPKTKKSPEWTVRYLPCESDRRDSKLSSRPHTLRWI